MKIKIEFVMKKTISAISDMKFGTEQKDSSNPDLHSITLSHLTAWIVISTLKISFAKHSSVAKLENFPASLQSSNVSSSP